MCLATRRMDHSHHPTHPTGYAVPVGSRRFLYGKLTIRCKKRATLLQAPFKEGFLATFEERDPVQRETPSFVDRVQY